MFFMEERTPEQLLEDIYSTESLPGLLCDARVELEEYDLRYRNWSRVGYMLIEDLAVTQGQIPVSFSTIDVFRRLLRLGKHNTKTLLAAAQILLDSSNLEQLPKERMDLRIYAGRIYEKIGLIDKYEECYIETSDGGRRQLMDFYMRNKLYIQAEELLYQAYLRGNNEALRLLDQFYGQVITSIRLFIPKNTRISDIQHFLSFPRLQLTHSPSFPLPKAHLSLFSLKIHSFATYLRRAKRLTRCITSVVNYVKLILTTISVLGLNPTEVIEAYIAKSRDNPTLYCEDIRISVLEYIGKWGKEKENKYAILMFLTNLARKWRLFEEVERMLIRLSNRYDWGCCMMLRESYK